MMFDLSDSTESTTQSLQAEQALMNLKQQVALHHDRQARLKRFYRESHEVWLCQAEQLRAQMQELESRLAPWMRRIETPRLSVVNHGEEAA